MQQSLFGSLIQDDAPAGGSPTATAMIDTLTASLHETVFTVLDLETTGLSAKKNAITEVVAIQYKGGQEIGKYSTLVKPTEPITEESEMITGISNEMVKNAPALVMVLSELAGFVGPNPVIVGHNIGFDINFLREKLTETGMSSFIPRFDLSRALCTKALAQRAMPGLPSYEGIAVATACGVKNDNPHRAEYDVRMSAGILFALLERLPSNGSLTEDTLEALLAYQGPLG